MLLPLLLAKLFVTTIILCPLTKSWHSRLSFKLVPLFWIMSSLCGSSLDTITLEWRIAKTCYICLCVFHYTTMNTTKLVDKLACTCHVDLQVFPILYKFINSCRSTYSILKCIYASNPQNGFLLFWHQTELSINLRMDGSHVFDIWKQHVKNNLS